MLLNVAQNNKNFFFPPAVDFEHWGRWSTVKEKAGVIYLNIFC